MAKRHGGGLMEQVGETTGKRLYETVFVEAFAGKRAANMAAQRAGVLWRDRRVKNTRTTVSRSSLSQARIARIRGHVGGDQFGDKIKLGFIDAMLIDRLVTKLRREKPYVKPALEIATLELTKTPFGRLCVRVI